MKLPSFFSIILLLFIYISPIQSQWSTNPTINNPLCTAPLDQLYPKIVSDGSGGAIITWEDKRNSNTDINIYTQRINSFGIVQWTSDGVTICDTIRNQTTPAIADDGSGGAIIVWRDQRDVSLISDIFAQRIDASGVVQWTTNGIPICETPESQFSPTIISDGSGGAIIAWNDFQNAIGNSDIYSQKINSSGEKQWTENGVVICQQIGGEQFLSMVSDGSGGAIIAWEDTREDNNDPDIYVQRINALGQVQWTENGVLISDAYSSVMPKCTSDGAGGAIITWVDNRDSISNHIYAQLIDTNGNVKWPSNGISIRSIEFGGGVEPTIVSDDAGGAIIAWEDIREGSQGFDIYAQKINASGIVQWTENGVAICQAAEYQVVPKIVSDGSGGAIITWGDKRAGGAFGDIYAQKINGSGVVQWTADGVAISTAVKDQNTPTIVSNGLGGAIITWGDKRNDFISAYDIYTQMVDSNGSLGVISDITPESDLLMNFNLAQNYPNPFNPSTTIKYTIPNVISTEGRNLNVLLRVYDILGNEVATLVNEEKPAGNYEIEFNAIEFSSGVYFFRMEAGSYVSTKKMILLR